MDSNERRILEAAEYLAALGFAVHWLRPPHGGSPDGRGKAPIAKGWQFRPWQSPSQLRASYRPGFNVGIHTGMVYGARVCVIVVDCDDEKAAQWCREHLPPTPLVVKTRAGYHFYYRAADGAGCRAHVNGLKLDVRAAGGNIVAPPSVHPLGDVYEWATPVAPTTVANMPQYQPEWFPTPAPVATGVRLPAPGTDAYRRASAYAQETPPAVQGQGGSLATFKLVVALVRGFALPEEQALSILQRDYNPRCEPPWSESELRHKVSRATQAVRVALGSLLENGERSR